MSLAFRALEALGVVGLFTEAAGGGDIFSPSAPCNAPLASPESYLDKIKLHSSLDNLEVVSDTTVTISHAAVSGGSSVDYSNGGGGPGGSGNGNSNINGIVRYGTGSADWTLVTHGLGYVPDVLVIVGSQVLIPGMPVQIGTVVGRYVSVYVDTTTVKLHEWSSVSGSGLGAVSKDYRVIVFHAPRSASGDKLFDFDESTGVLKLGFDRFSSDRRYLQVVTGGSPFTIAYGRTLDISNGGVRIAQPDGTLTDIEPSSLQGRWVVAYDGATYTGSYGASMNYNSSFTGSPQISVQTP